MGLNEHPVYLDMSTYMFLQIYIDLMMAITSETKTLFFLQFGSLGFPSQYCSFL